MTTRRRRFNPRPKGSTPRTEDEFRGRHVLLLGVSGAIGGAIAAELKDRGYWVRGMTRVPALADVDVDELYVGDLLDSKTFPNALKKVDIIVSAAGAPFSFVGMGEGRYSFRAIDDQGHRALLNAALEARIRRFAYVSPFGGMYMGVNEYIRSHESFATALTTSGMHYLVVRSTPVFTAFDGLLTKAKKGKLRVIGDGSAEVNPIHPDDLAVAIVDALESGDESNVDVGGPETLTRREIAEMALEAWGREPKVGTLPVALAALWSRLAAFRGGHNRLVSAASTAFAVTSLVAPAYGELRLADYFAERVAEMQSED